MFFKQSKYYYFYSLLLFFVFNPCNILIAQDKGSKWFVDNPKPVLVNWDTNYYASYMEEMTLRWYSSVKYTGFRIINQSASQNLLFLSNKNIIVGAGASYSWFTLNIGLKYPWINDDNNKYGPTKYLDLQTHMFLRKMNIDLYAQYYKGYYLGNSGNVIDNWPQGDTFLIRPDIKTFTLGFNAQYVYNWKKFSYKAIYNQNEWQKKSAGSWIAGVNAFYYTNRGDSSLIPKNLKDTTLFNGLNYNNQNVINIGVSVGYYYTLVIQKHYFVSLGLGIGPSLGYSWLDTQGAEKASFANITFNLNILPRFSFGYNGSQFFAGFSFFQQTFFNQVPSNDIWNNFHTGNARIYFVYRFGLRKPLKPFNPRYWKITNRTNDGE